MDEIKMDPRIINLTSTLTVLSDLSSSDLLAEAAKTIRDLYLENAELKDKLWASDRAAHAHDEMEPEDG